MNKNMTDLAIKNEENCFKVLFSGHLLNIAKIIMYHISDVEDAMDNAKNDDEPTAVVTILDYAQTHDFSKFKIESTSRGLPFPYLSTILLTDEEFREIFIEDLKCDFPTACAILFARDLELIKNLYRFINKNDVLGEHKNVAIYELKAFLKDIMTIYNENIKRNVHESIQEEIKSYVPRISIPKNFEPPKKVVINANSPEEVVKLLKQFGYSDTEIKTIMSGLPLPNKNESKYSDMKVENNIIKNINWKN